MTKSFTFGVALAALLAMPSCSAYSLEEDEALYVSDKPYTWVFNYSHDMQLPELPTGCEATAASTLARMNGELLTKTQIADAMPRSDYDHKYTFLGDPYTDTGWGCEPPAVVETLNGLLRHGKHEAYEVRGRALEELLLPAMVWTTMHLRDANLVDGFPTNTHCMIVTRVGTTVDVIDPLVGPVTYPRERFELIYDSLGEHAVCMKEKERRWDTYIS